MARERNALRAGIFIVVSLALAVGIIVGVKGLSGLMEEMQLRTVCFALRDDLAGLRVGDDVRIGGFKVGDVRSVEIVQANDPRLKKLSQSSPAKKDQAAILVTFAMPKKFELRDGARIGVQSTITEKTCLNIDRLGDGDALAADAPMVGRPSPMGALMSALADAAPQINEILGETKKTVVNVNEGIAEIRPRVTGILDDVRKQTIPTVNGAVASYRTLAETATGLVQEVRAYVKPIVDKYNAVAGSTTRMMDTVSDLFGDTRPDFRTTMKNLSAATGTIKDELPRVFTKVRDILEDVNTAVASAKTAMEDVKKTMENARDMTGSAKAVVVGNKGRLDSMIHSLETTGNNLELASAEIRSRPWRLLYTPKKNEVSNLVLFDAARDFARGASELNEAAQALKFALNDKQADPDKLRKLRDELDRSFENFSKVEKVLWEKVKE